MSYSPLKYNFENRTHVLETHLEFNVAHMVPVNLYSNYDKVIIARLAIRQCAG